MCAPDIESQKCGIELSDFVQFLQNQNKGVTRNDLFMGQAAKLFRTLNEELPKQTRFCQIDGQPIIYRFRHHDLKDIFRIEIDFETYTFVSEIGRGGNGIAKLYRNAAGKCMVVKSPLVTTNNDPNASQQARELAIELLKSRFKHRERDMDIMRTLYPHDGLYVINSNFNVNNYDFYAISPYIPGSDLATFCGEQKTAHDVIETLIAVTAELQRIHSLGIIHGDISADNIRVWRDPATNRVQVRFIDFEWAYYLNEPMRITVIPDGHRWAPEKNVLCYPQLLDESFEFPMPKAAPSQDVFSYGDMIKAILKQCASLKLPDNLNPMAEQCQAREPGDRPELKNILTELYKAKSALALPNTAQFMTLGFASKNLSVCDAFFSKERETKMEYDEVTHDDFVITIGSLSDSITTGAQPVNKEDRCIIM
jgi:hypothetical protein